MQIRSYDRKIVLELKLGIYYKNLNKKIIIYN